MLKSLKKSYYKSQIILTFSLLTALMILGIAKTSYNFVKKTYLEQLSEQVQILTQLIANQTETKFLDFINTETENSFAKNYYRKTLQSLTQKTKIHSAFLFSEKFVILANSDSIDFSGKVEPRLLLNRKEIFELEQNNFTTSLPFKANERWYLWGFYRLSKTHWLGVQESANRLEQVEEFGEYFWWFGGIGIILTFLAGWLLAQTLSKPIDKLVHFSSELEAGKFNAQIPPNIKGELLILAKAMDKMREGLSNTQKEKEQMLAQIAHEIQNPLGGIELLAGLVKEDLAKDSQNSNYLEKISREISGLKSLISSYLNFSRPRKPEPQNVSITKIIEESFELLKDKIEIKKPKIQLEIEVEKIYFDEQQLKQILINLISNSLYAIKTEGVIKIRCTEKHNSIKLEVTDNGNGISELDSTKIFEPFFTNKTEGTGLGLAIAKKICFENNAEISVKNNSKGCTFTIKVLRNNK